MTSRRGLATLVLVLAALAMGWAVGRRSHPAPPAPAVTQAARQLWTCSMHPQVLQDQPGQCPICGMQLTPVVTDAGADNAVQIDPVVVQNMGVRVATVTRGRLAVAIRAVGVLAEAEPTRRDVDLRVSGWIERLYADTEGMHLDAGDPLFDLYSPELQAAVGELIAARRARAADGGSGAGQRLYEAASRKLELYGLSAAEVARLARLERAPRAITFRSPIRGHLVTKNVVQGAAVERGATVMRIVDHSRLWLDARVFEQDLPLVRLGEPATATIAALPGASVDGKVVFIHPHLDEATRTAMVRIEVANPTLVLRPGMYGTVEIATESPQATLLVPREAVIDTGRRQIAFVAEAGGRFVPHDLTLGSESDGIVQVLAGLAEGDEVVTSGQFLLDAESRMREAIQKHLAEGLAPPPSGHEGHAR